MIDALEASGRIRPGITTLIEPTSGNTGIALAFVAAARGYRLILVMPETMSVERRKMLKLLGAELVLTEGGARHARRDRARGRTAQGDPDAVIPQQFQNPGQSGNPSPDHRGGNLERHQGEIDVFIAGVGTGGTITGVGQVLKARQAVATGDRGRARRQPGAFRRQPRARTRSRGSAPASFRPSSTLTSMTRW